MIKAEENRHSMEANVQYLINTFRERTCKRMSPQNYMSGYLIPSHEASPTPCSKITSESITDRTTTPYHNMFFIHRDYTVAIFNGNHRRLAMERTDLYKNDDNRCWPVKIYGPGP